MNPSVLLGRIAAFAARNAIAVLIAVAVLAICATVFATRLTTDAGTDTLADADSETFQATDAVRRSFGEDPVVIVARSDVRNLVLNENLGRLLRLEGCLAGNPPEGVEPLPGPCTELAELQPAKFVSGPATFLNQAVIGIGKQLQSGSERAQAEASEIARLVVQRARAAGVPEPRVRVLARVAAEEVLTNFRNEIIQQASTYGLTGLPRIDDPLFVANVVFDERQQSGTPKAKLSFLFPNKDSAQIIVRLRPDLTDAERARALDLIQDAVADETPREECAPREGPAEACFALSGGGSYLVSGAPIVIDGLAGVLQSELFVLFVVALALMALTLLVAFRSRLRLLPLGVALAAAGLTFGALSLFGGKLTMASIAVLPVLIGLSVDYAIQLQARYDEALAGGATGPDAARIAAERGAPMVGVACLATTAGFLVLQLSPTPMVRGFGLLLVAGIAIAFALAMTAGFAALSLRRPAGQGRRFSSAQRVPAPIRRAAEVVGRVRGRAGASVEGFSRSSLAIAISHPGRVLAVALALGLCGWAAGAETETVTDVRELVPQSLPEVRDLEQLEDATGVTGELDVNVQADDLTDPAVIGWMAAFKQRVLESGGFTGDFPSCREADICPGPALTDFLGDSPEEVTPERVDALVAALPPYDLRGVITRDPESGGIGDTANIAFAIRTLPLDEQQALIERVRAEIDPPGPGNGPPEGVSVRLAGLPVLAAEASTDLESSRYWLTLAGLIAVALVLLAIYRSVSRALVPLIPIALATGWSSLILAAMDIPLNPLSAALGALVIAIATEFSVILASRFHEERAAGHSLGEGLRRSYARTGAAVLASGATAIAGFAALTASDIRMLRDFGLVTVVDLGVALIGVMLVLPAALVWAERERRAGEARLPVPRALRPQQR